MMQVFIPRRDLVTLLTVSPELAFSCEPIWKSGRVFAAPRKGYHRDGGRIYLDHIPWVKTLARCVLDQYPAGKRFKLCNGQAIIADKDINLHRPPFAYLIII